MGKTEGTETQEEILAPFVSDICPLLTCEYQWHCWVIVSLPPSFGSVFFPFHPFLSKCFGIQDLDNSFLLLGSQILHFGPNWSELYRSSEAHPRKVLRPVWDKTSGIRISWRTRAHRPLGPIPTLCNFIGLSICISKSSQVAMLPLVQGHSEEQ